MKKNLLIIAFVLTGFISTTPLVAQVTANQPSDLVICDDNNDGFAFFDLTITEPEIIGGQDPTDLVITFHVTQADATNALNPIVNSTSYFSGGETIWIRVESILNGDFDTTSFELIVHLTPEVVAVSDLVVLDENNDGVETFDLTSKIPEILNGQTNVDVTFYESQVDAEANINVIVNPSAYTNTINPQTIYTRLESLELCYLVGEFVIFADPNLGIEQDSFTEIILYPNPTTEVINLQSNNLTETVEVLVYNLQGQVLLLEYKTPVNGNVRLNLSNLTKGIYFIKITTENVTVVTKIVKQ